MSSYLYFFFFCLTHYLWWILMVTALRPVARNHSLSRSFQSTLFRKTTAVCRNWNLTSTAIELHARQFSFPHLSYLRTMPLSKADGSIVPKRYNGNQQVCEPCRKWRVWCDHSTPVCGRWRCRRVTSECAYDPSPM